MIDAPVRGAILVETAYAQGKMLDCSGWGDLPRGITPSDVDLVFDNAGRILFCELSTQCDKWEDLKRGQRMLYEELVVDARHCAVLLRHSTPTDEQINTKTGIDVFQPMVVADGAHFYRGPLQGDKWPGFVKKWFENPDVIRNWIIGS